MDAVSPDKLLQESFKVDSNKILVNRSSIQIHSKVNILAFGKASVKMYLAAKKVLGPFFGRGILITHQSNIDFSNFDDNEELVYSSHPFITEKSYEAGKKALTFVKKSSREDILLTLVSGGGSAMLVLPLKSITLDEKIKFISKVMLMGVPEREVNVLKKSLSELKGGKLAESSNNKTIVNLILSDERNHDLSAISSGPTVCNKEVDPIKIMDQYDLWKITPSNIKKAINRHGVKKRIGCSKEIVNSLIGSRENLVNSISKTALEHNFDFIFCIENIASLSPNKALEKLQEEYLKIYNSSRVGKTLVICTGEIQVDVSQKKDTKGGRNQHITALVMTKMIFPVEFSFVAIATDGMDFMEGVHGAFFDSSRSDEIKNNYDLINQSILDCTTYNIHRKFNTLIEGKITGTNMADFYLFAFEKQELRE